MFRFELQCNSTELNFNAIPMPVQVKEQMDPSFKEKDLEKQCREVNQGIK